jgi:hypothetical protein
MQAAKKRSLGVVKRGRFVVASRFRKTPKEASERKKGT